MAHEFFNFIEHLIEDQIPEQLKNILLLTGFSCRTAFLNTSQSWLGDIEEFIRSQSECDYYRNRMPHGLNLQYFSLPPGYKAILIGIKQKLENHCPNIQNERVNTPAICMQPEPQIVEQIVQEPTIVAPSTSNALQNYKTLSVAEVTDILENVLKCWQRTHELTITPKFNISNKQLTSANGESIMKISATVICPECDKPIQVYMDELKKRWIVSNLNSHFNRLHRRNKFDDCSNAKQPRWQHIEYMNYTNNVTTNRSVNDEIQQEVQYDSVTRSFYEDTGKIPVVKKEFDSPNTFNSPDNS